MPCCLPQVLHFTLSFRNPRGQMFQPPVDLVSCLLVFVPIHRVATRTPTTP